MANSITTQLLLDGPKTVSLRVVGVLDTSNASAVTIADPALLSSIDPATPGTHLANQLCIERIQYSIEDGLEVELIWDATTPVIAEFLAGRGKMEFRPTGGLQNNSGAGKTGKLLLTTLGYSSGTVGFTITLTLRKQVV